MKNDNLKQDKEYNEYQYKTKIDKLLGTTFHKLYDKIGVFGMIVLCLVTMIILIVLIIRLISEKYWQWFGFNLADKNNIGDALGGMTAPFIGGTGVILTFFAFWVQYKFNKSQTKVFEINKIQQKKDEYNKIFMYIVDKYSSKDLTLNIVISKTIERLYEISKENEFSYPSFLKLYEKYFLEQYIKTYKLYYKNISDYKGDNCENEIKSNYEIIKISTDILVFSWCFLETIDQYIKDLESIGVKKNIINEEIKNLLNKSTIYFVGYNNSFLALTTLQTNQISISTRKILNDYFEKNLDDYKTVQDLFTNLSSKKKDYFN